MKGLLTVLMFSLIISTGTVQADDIIYGQNLEHNLNCQETDEHLFWAYPGYRVTIMVSEVLDFGSICGGVSCYCFDQKVQLLDFEGNLLAEDSYSHGNDPNDQGIASIKGFLLETEGDYRIRISDGGGDTGHGRVTTFLQRTNGPDGTIATLTSGDTYNGQLSAGHVHTFTIESTTNQHISLEMLPTGDSVVDPRLQLYDPSGLLLAIPDTGVISLNIGSGEYTILAYSHQNKSGGYSLSLNTAPVPVQPTTWGRLKTLYH